MMKYLPNIKRWIWLNPIPSVFAVSMVAGIIFFNLFNILFPLKTDVPYSKIVLSSDSIVLHTFLSEDDKWRFYCEKEEIPDALKSIFLEKEDQYFYYHYGVNTIAIIRALWSNIWSGKRISGASTISMQVARLLEPRKRNLQSKIIEAFRALQLEVFYSKEQILQFYLNLAPYGGNIEGIKAASVFYFGVLPSKMSVSQMAALTVIPNKPTSLKVGWANEKIREERNRWLKHYFEQGLLNAQTYKDAAEEPFNYQRKPSPKFAPHYAYELLSKYRYRKNIVGSLNMQLQDQIESISKNYINRQRIYGIHNASVLVVENKTGNIVAYLGNPFFSDNENSGQVDGVQAVRSPGSTLKPLAYAMAIDEGIITPKKIVLDVPTSFGSYSPENFNEEFNGKVKVEEALALSLNVPAVRITEKLGAERLINRLSKSGFSQIKKDQHKLGLSTVLGGCGVSLEELTCLYRAFARKGKFSALNILNRPLPYADEEIISSEAAYMITEILTRPERPDFPNNFQSSYHIPKIAWKTGTSYGRRDAWSIGFNERYTVGVWVGNFDGTGVNSLTGAQKATPLLFEMFNVIDYNAPDSWYNAPEELEFRLVCSESGNVPNTFCHNQVVDYYLPEKSSGKKCEHMKKVYLSADEKYSYCTSCMPVSGYKEKLVRSHAPELIHYFEEENILYEKIPLHNPACDRVFTSRAPKIISPTKGLEYIVNRGDPQALMLSCYAEETVDSVFWYVNDRFISSSAATKPVFYKPQAGELKISCSDDKGRNTDINITVLYE